jgi:hypothetical protein
MKRIEFTTRQHLYVHFKKFSFMIALQFVIVRVDRMRIMCWISQMHSHNKN